MYPANRIRWRRYGASLSWVTSAGDSQNAKFKRIDHSPNLEARKLGNNRCLPPDSNYFGQSFKNRPDDRVIFFFISIYYFSLSLFLLSVFFFIFFPSLFWFKFEAAGFDVDQKMNKLWADCHGICHWQKYSSCWWRYESRPYFYLFSLCPTHPHTHTHTHTPFHPVIQIKYFSKKKKKKKKKKWKRYLKKKQEKELEKNIQRNNNSWINLKHISAAFLVSYSCCIQNKQ